MYYKNHLGDLPLIPPTSQITHLNLFIKALTLRAHPKAQTLSFQGKLTL